MAKIDRLTDKAVRGIAVPPKGNRIYYDLHPDSPRGFGIRVTSNSARSFILRYVAEHKEHRYTIGAFPELGTERARKEANRLKAQISLSNGVDHPMADRKNALAKHKARATAETYKDAVEDYVQREQIGRKGNATAAEVKQRLLADGALWLDRPLAEIGDSEIYRHLEEIRDGNPTASPPTRPRRYLANRLHSYLRTFFKWCASPGVKKIDGSPMVDMARPWCGEEPRTRFFGDNELDAIWRAADEIDGVAGAYIKVAMLTGKRRSALASMKWSELDSSGVWTPARRSGEGKRNKRLHSVPLPRLALSILEGIRPTEPITDNVFPGRTKGTHLDPGSTLQRKIRKIAGIDDFILHALRHTVETRLAELRIAPHIRDLLLDHAPARGAGAGYDHYHYTDEMREALEVWANHISEVVGLEPEKEAAA